MGEGNGGLEVGAVDEAAARPQPQAQPAEQRVDLASQSAQPSRCCRQ